MLIRDLIINVINGGIDFTIQFVWTDVSEKLSKEYNISLYKINYVENDKCIKFLKSTSECIVFIEMMQQLTDSLDKSNSYGIELTENIINEIKIKNFDLLNEIIEQIKLLKNICTIIWIVFIVENNICNNLKKCIDENNNNLIF
jgi:hypothetical protein